METVKTRVISLSHSIDRRERMRRQLDSAGVEFTFFDAIDGAQANFLLADKRNDPFTIKWFGITLSDAELATYASHYLLWQECVTENRALLIMEDHLQLQGNFRQAYERLPELAERYAFLKLCGTHVSRRPRQVARVARNLNIVRHRSALSGTGCYLITPAVAGILLARSTHFTQVVDIFMERPYFNSFLCYTLMPWPTVRAEVPSVIGDRRSRLFPLGWYGKTRVKLFYYCLQVKRRLIFYFGW